jgi:hypothetical protein
VHVVVFSDNDQCAVGGIGFVIGVFAGCSSFTGRHIGPKVPSFKTAATAFLEA